MEDLIKAKIKAVYLHPTQKVPLVFVTDKTEQVVIPMMIGFLEAQAILTAWQGMLMPRPMTVDLLRQLIEEDFGSNLEKILIHDVRDGAFLASLIIQQNGRTIARDSRPSDALALAVRTKAPIYFTQELIDKTIAEHANAKAMLEFLEAEVQDNDEIIKF
jgi:uncharacterized protein